MPSTGTAATVI